jgi:hypothetical protein
VNVMNVDLIEIDDETYARVKQANGEPVEFQIVLHTPQGNVFYLTARGAWKDEGQAIEFEFG